MEIVSNGDNLHEMSFLFSGIKNKKNIAKFLSSAEYAQRVVNVKGIGYTLTLSAPNFRRHLPSAFKKKKNKKKKTISWKEVYM